MRRSGRCWAVALVLVAGAPRAHATYSIVAADTATREVGGSGTSCLSGADVYIIYGSVPGVGAVHTQATYSSTVHDRAVELVREGLAPADVIDALDDTSLDPDVRLRQFGVVDVSGRTAGFTGTGARAYAGDRQGRLDDFRYSAQGNILTSEAVLSQAAAAFEAPACDLAERLMRALEAGGERGEGDSRCTASRGIPSDSAFVQVDRPNEAAGSYLELHVESSGDRNPLPLLRAEFDAWRETHPCPAAGGDPDPPPGAPGPAAPAAEADPGCGCRVFPTGSRPPLAAWGFALAVLLARGRRWNARRFRC
ncbi:MAG TPA: DUF1028 domain-containing protein [Polyangiaceae bacterium]